MVSLFRKKTKAEKVSKFAEDIIIRKAEARERVKQRVLSFEKRKARAIERIRRPPLKVFGRKARGIAVKAGRRAGKDIGKSLRGFAEKIGKPREAEKETLVILGGQPSRRLKGRVRIVRAQQEPFAGDLGVGGMGDLGLNVDLLGERPRRKQKKLKPIRFF